MNPLPEISPLTTKGQVPFSADLNYMNFKKHDIKCENAKVSFYKRNLKSCVFYFTS